MPPSLVFAFIAAGATAAAVCLRIRRAKQHRHRMADRKAMMKYLSKVDGDGNSSGR